MKVSIIIVHYQVKKELLACLQSIYTSKPKTSFEIIVVDNDEKGSISKELNRKFPKVRYIKSENNIGFGAGNNLGAKQAKGEYLFVLNPDTLVLKGAIDSLITFIEKDSSAGVFAPLLLNEDQNPLPTQGALELTTLRAIFALSAINKYFQNNTISKRYWLKDWDKKTVREVDVMPGTAFIIRRDVFENAGRFDEFFFLFFEEHDLAKRVQGLGYKIFMLPEARVIHLWGRSTKQQSDADTDRYFRESRYRYFRKHYGIVQAFIVDILLSKPKRILHLLFGLFVVLWFLISCFRLTYNVLRVFTEERRLLTISDYQKKEEFFGDIHGYLSMIEKSTDKDATLLILENQAYEPRMFYLSLYYLYPRSITIIAPEKFSIINGLHSWDYVATYYPLKNSKYMQAHTIPLGTKRIQTFQGTSFYGELFKNI